jgi:hypothetical protein
MPTISGVDSHVIDKKAVNLSPKLQAVATLAKIIRLDRISE